MKLPPLNTLQAFEAAARLSNLSRAGNELNVTHAAISSQIKRLETWFGRQLFQRSGRGVTLTPVGQAFYGTVKNALAAIADTSQELKRSRDKKAVSVACLPSIATRWLVPYLADFTRKYPDIALQVSYAKALEEFDAERYDVLITHLPLASAQLSNTKLFSRINKPVASPHYIEKNRSLLNGAFDGVQLLHDETIQAWNDWFVRAELAPTNLTHGPIYQDFNLLATAVIAGHGVALCPVEVFRREISAGDLIILSHVATLEDQGYYVVSARVPSHSVAMFTRWFVAACAPSRTMQARSQPHR